jgi:ribosome-associated toxin RatA of RatAB toxin-antitoxin module
VGAKRAERQIVVQGTPQQCFDALLDFETYPEWQDAVRDCEIQSRDGKGRGQRVWFEIDAKVKRLSYTLDYSYEEPHMLTWEFVEGDVRDIDGEFVLEDQGDGTTLATYGLRLDAGMWMPGKIASILNDQVMQRSVEDLKARVEAS